MTSLKQEYELLKEWEGKLTSVQKRRIKILSSEARDAKKGLSFNQSFTPGYKGRLSMLPGLANVSPPLEDRIAKRQEAELLEKQEKDFQAIVDSIKNKISQSENDKPGEKKLRPNQKDKKKCQKIAIEVWEKYPILDIVHMKKHPEIKNIVGKYYTGKNTLQSWLSDVDPEKPRKGGTRDPVTRKKQQKICKLLNIDHDFKFKRKGT